MDQDLLLIQFLSIHQLTSQAAINAKSLDHS